MTRRFPVVSKTTSDLLYLWLNDQGEMLLESEKSDELIGYITSRDWLQIDVYYFNPDK
jgi:hypothetical protein